MKITKKLLSAILTISMLLCTIPAFAADSEGLEEAILSVKSRIEIPAEFSEFESYINTSEDATEYSLRWSADDYSSIRINVNDKNDVTSYSLSMRQLEETTPQFAAFTDEQLVQKTIDWLTAVNPSWISELRLDDAYVVNYSSIHNSSTHICFERVINGLNFLNNNVSFNINNRTGEITNMYSLWNYENDIPDPSAAMSETAAMDEFFKLSPLELEYEAVYDIGNLVYNPTNPYVIINAQKGGEISEEYHENAKNEAAMDSAVSGVSASAAPQLTEAEIGSLEKIEGLLSEDELIKLARSIEYTALPDAEYISTSYNKGYATYKEYSNSAIRYFADMSFNLVSESGEAYYGYVVFDAETGELIRYYASDYSSYIEDKDSTPAIDEAAASETGKKFIDKYAPEQSQKIKLKNDNKNNPSYGDYYLKYIRHENDIPYKADYININVSSKTGLVTSFNKYWNAGIIFENPEKLITTRDAEKAYSDNAKIELSYTYEYEKAEPGKTPKKHVALCYTIEDMVIDAESGNPKSNEVTDVQNVEASDISGHYAEEQIKALINSGMISLKPEEPEFRPNDVITKGELADLVAALKNSYVYDRNALESSLRKLQIIMPEELFDAENKAQRIDGVTYIIRAIGYREVAELPGIFNCSFTDAASISQNQIGYITIARGLNIVQGDENGAFNPNSPLTRADAAIMIYNYLSR